MWGNIERLAAWTFLDTDAVFEHQIPDTLKVLHARICQAIRQHLEAENERLRNKLQDRQHEIVGLVRRIRQLEDELKSRSKQPLAHE